MKTLQKLSVVASVAVLAIGVSAGSAQAASLVGQTINVDYFFPDVNSLYDSTSVNVAANSSDVISTGGGLFTVDPSALGFSISPTFGFALTGLFQGSQFTFNGIKFSNLNFGDGSVVTGVLIDNQTGAFTAFDSSRISFTDNSVSLNFQNLGQGSEGSFQVGNTLDVSLQTARPVPVPGAIFGVVVAGGALVARQRKNAKAKQTVA
ncbi:hypothetical protein HCU40_17955 [Pseudanabaena biceps]|nr:hypothetical protein [Pseudanabaena biceps]